LTRGSAFARGAARRDFSHDRISTTLCFDVVVEPACVAGDEDSSTESANAPVEKKNKVVARHFNRMVRRVSVSTSSILQFRLLVTAKP
jgi:hypothetical protein